jgi:hypothetical protein
MKHFLFLILSFIGATLAGASQIVIAISPTLSGETLERVKLDILHHVLENAPSQSTITIMDAWSGDIAVSFEIPKLVVDSTSARRRNLHQPLGALYHWFEGLPRGADPNRKGAVNLPLLVRAIADSSPSSLLIVGSPVYVDPYRAVHHWHQSGGGHEGFWFPSDAHFFAPAGVSPWTVQPRLNRLNGATIQWIIPEEISYPKGRYEEMMKRFYTLYLEREGGRLVRFDSLMDQAMTHLDSTSSLPFSYEINPDHERIEMLPAFEQTEFQAGEAETVELEPEIRREIRPAPDVTAGGWDGTDISNSVMDALTVDTYRGEVGIAIGWDDPVDFDLVVFPGNGADPIYFGNRNTPQGRYFKDRRTPEDIPFEEVILTAFGADAEAWVNFHAANAKLTEPPSGEYYISVDRVIYTGFFKFGGMRGNLGRSLEQRAQSPFWIKLDLRNLPKPEALETKNPIH